MEPGGAGSSTLSMVAELLRLRLRCDSAAPRLARDAVAELAVIGPVKEDAVLVVSELTTNAVLHSGCTPEDEFELLAELVPAGVRIAVIDSGRSGTEPRRGDRDSLQPGGMGLRVVEKLSRRWGSERRGSVSVWAELAL